VREKNARYQGGGGKGGPCPLKKKIGRRPLSGKKGKTGGEAGGKKKNVNQDGGEKKKEVRYLNLRKTRLTTEGPKDIGRNGNSKSPERLLSHQRTLGVR